ncbi:MAG: deoxyguanosinetriphosphate triphosphohydrolase family protein [Spirochaetia bacterium]
MSTLFFQNPLSENELKSRIKTREEDTRDLRGMYFRDTTAIIHSYPFRRLKHKTQVFFAPKNDHICTRIEHVMHVATIAATACRALGLDSDLAWAIGLGHDLGHSPFGHLGEKILEELAADQEDFQHEMYSLRVVDHLARYGKGLNLTYAVRDGIVNHCGEKFEQEIEPDCRIKDLSSIKDRSYYPSTWEGCVVRMCDKVAYLGRDLEDAIRLSVIQQDDPPKEAIDVLGKTNSEIIDTLTHDLISCSMKTGKIGFSDQVFEAYLLMKNFNYKNIYISPTLANYHTYFERILKTLYHYLSELFLKNGNDFPKYAEETNRLARRFGAYLQKMYSFYDSHDKSFKLLVLDYVAGMTDDYAIDCVSEIMVPRSFDFTFQDRPSEKQ